MSSEKVNTVDMIKLYVADRNSGFLIHCTELGAAPAKYQAWLGDEIWLDGLTLRVLSYYGFSVYSVKLYETGCIWYYDREIAGETLRVACDTLKNFTNEMLRRNGA